MPNDQIRRGIAAIALAAGLAGVTMAARGQGVGDSTFAAVMAAAMERMDHDMMTPPSGDADRDFATMMIPHHQGAVEMAEAELRFGRDPVLRRLAQGIIVEQRQEIAVMRQAIAALPPAPIASPDMTTMPMHMQKEH
jgi:uncharacterized protein (DUF305 family)